MRILELQINCPDLEKVSYFYHEVLGLEFSETNEEQCALRIGYSTLRFRYDESDQTPCYHFAFNIPENQIEEAKKWLKSRDVKLLRHNKKEVVHFESWNAHSIYFLDPVGNVVEFIARHNLDNVNQSPFGQYHIEGVSEIGLPTDNVEQLSKEITDNVGIDNWSASEPTDEFCVKGDDSGLLLVVESNRPWLPTDIDAIPHPVFVAIEGDLNLIWQDASRNYIIESRIA